MRCLGREVLGAEGVAEFDPTRLTISALDLGHSGTELETILRDDYAVAVEAADPLAIILNVTFGDTMDDLRTLVDSLRDYAARHADASGRQEAAARWLRLRPPPFTRQVLIPREAFFAPSVALPLPRLRRQGQRRDRHALSAGDPGPGPGRGDRRRDRHVPR